MGGLYIVAGFWTYGYFLPVAMRAIVVELQRQGLTGRVDNRAFGSRNEVIRKSLSTRDFRLRFGKRSVKVIPVEISLGASQPENWLVWLKENYDINSLLI